MKITPSTTNEAISALLQRAAAELLVLDHNLKLKSGDIDAGTLAEFRQVVDLVRHTAYTVQRWVETCVQQHDA